MSVSSTGEATPGITSPNSRGTSRNALHVQRVYRKSPPFKAEEPLAPARWGGRCSVSPAEMEAAARRRPREQERQERQEREPGDGGRVLSPSLSGQSYWLDLWLFILFDLALFLLIYLLP